MKTLKKTLLMLLIVVAIGSLNSCFVGVSAHKDHPYYNPNSDQNGEDDDYDLYDGFNNSPLNNGGSTASINRADITAFASC